MHEGGKSGSMGLYCYHTSVQAKEEKEQMKERQEERGQTGREKTEQRQLIPKKKSGANSPK